MKKNHYSILFSALLVSANAFCTQTETTDNYAYGAELTLTNSDSMFSQVDLDRNVYTQTVSPSLDDVRVFNRNGQTVPFTLVNVYDEHPIKQQFDMVLYPIDEDSLVTNTNPNTNTSNYSVSIQGQDVNISVDKSNDNRGKYINTYLLQIPADRKVDNPINHLKLSFAPQQGNWQATVDVSYSEDLRYWNSVTSNVQVMTLTNNNQQTLILNDINFQPYSYYKSKNWLISLYSQKPIPNLIKVEAFSQSASLNNTLYPIDFSLQNSDNHTAIYTLPSPQPVRELSVELYNARSILPVSLYYKVAISDKTWIKLDDRIIRRTDSYDEPTRIALHDRLITQIKFETINSSFEQAPKVIAYRNKVNLIFNSANNAPFILAWGSANAKAAALNGSDLLTDKESTSSLPQAFIGNPVKLAGDSALKVKIAEPSSNFPRWIIWLGLVIAAAVLILLAVKLAKEIKKQ